MQWHKIKFDKETVGDIGEIRIHPKTEKDGTKTVKVSHPELHDWDDMDFSADAPEATDKEGNKLHHIHDGEVDHIRVLPQARKQGISVHALFHDKNGDVVRRDSVFHVDKDAKV